MRKLRLLSAAMTVVMLASLVASFGSVSVSAAPANIEAVAEEMPAGNVLYKTDFDSSDLAGVNSSKNIEHINTATGSYMQISRITANHSGFKISNPRRAILPGKYKFTGYFRMMYEDELTELRLIFYQGLGDKDYKSHEFKIYPTSHAWMKVEFYIELTDFFNKIVVCGGGDTRFIQSYCIDNFSLVPVDEFPEGYKMQTSWGKKVSAEEAEASQVDSLFNYPKWDEEYHSQFEVQGVIVNQDANGYISGLAADGGNADNIRDFALGYEGSHVTDFMICLCNTVSTFPSELETWTDLADKYVQTEENGVAVDYTKEGTAKAAYRHFIVNGIDYIDIWCKTFPTIGINPWLSIRMNDLHGHGEKTSILLSDYYHENPQYRRVRHGSKAAGAAYYRSGLDFAHEDVRQRMLDYINEALSRYDCYGLELDWQREIWIWSHGGEYVGLDILNEFTREVDRIIAIYEEKYGHEIKLGIRCASDIETNYDFGLDILTWAAEGILDQVIPTGRYDTVDSNVPVKEWTSLLHPYGVIVAPCIEQYISSANRTYHTLETYNGMAASFLSQGADKIALFNAYLAATQGIQDKHKVSTTDNKVGGTWRHWNIVSTIGSYEKLMTLNRRVVLTYNDTHMIWRKSNAQLPQTVEAGQTMVLRIPLGDVPTGATVTFKFSADGQNLTNHPTIYINSKLATYKKTEACEGGYTNSQVLAYTVPESAFDGMYVVAEIVPQHSLTVDHAEVLIEVAK